MRGEGAAQQDRADGDAVSIGGLEHVEQDVGRIQVRAHQQVGVAIQRAVGHQAVAQFRQQGGVAVHFAVTVDVRGHAAEDVAGLAHLDGRRAAGASELRVRHEGHLGRDAEVVHFLGRHDGDLGQRLGIGVIVDVGVGDEQGAVAHGNGVDGGQRGAGACADHVADVAQVHVEAAERAAQHGVGIAQAHHQGGNQRGGAANGSLGGFLRDAFPSHQTPVFFPVGAEARVVVGVDDLDVLAGFHSQASLLDAGLDHRGATDQQGAGQAFVDGGLGAAQHAFVFTLGIGHALEFWCGGLGGSHDRAHQQAGGVDEAIERLPVGIHVLDGTGSHAGGCSGLGHGRGDAQDQARIEGRGDDVVGTEVQVLAGVGAGHLVAGLGLGQGGDLAHAGQLHLFGDARCAAVQRTPEDVREAQHVVDLVRVVRTAGGDDAVGAGGTGIFGADLGLGVGQGQDHRLAGHGLDHVAGQHAGGRAAQEHVGVLHDVGQRAGVGVLCVACLGLIEAARAALVDDALGVGHVDVLRVHAQGHEDVQAGQGRSACARDGHLHLADGLAHQFQAVDQCRARNDGGAVLVVVEDGDLHLLAQLALDVEALGGLDVFQVDAAQGGFQCADDLDQLVGVTLGQLDVEHVDAGKLLEQAALAFHHRLAGQRADVAQAQHGGAIGDHAHQVAARGVFGGLGGISLDVQARIGHARRIGQRQVTLVGQRLGGTDGDLARRRLSMVFPRGIAQGGFSSR